ncbi:MAG: hypothetical protein K6U08_01590 [Firmicutes bacterium]|nr:hypothetical protein [Bacillota bacterium]
MDDRDEIKELRRRAEEHLRRLGEHMEELEKPFYRVILEYVMLNHTRPGLTTLREMERVLGLPYSRLKKLVDALIEKGILEEHRLGTVRPLSIGDLDRAFELGYLEPTYDRLVAWVKAAYSPRQAAERRSTTELVGRESMAGILSDFPKWHVPALWSADWAVAVCDVALALARAYLPDVPPEVRERALAEYERIRAELQGRKPAEKLEAFFREAEERARLIASRLSGFEDVLGALGSEAHHTIPFIYTIAPPRFGAGEGLIWPLSVWSRDVWFEMGAPESFTLEEANRAAASVAAKQLRYIMLVTRRCLELIEEHGVEGTLQELNRPRELYASPARGWVHVRPRYTTEHLLYHVVALTYALALAAGMGVEEELFEEGRRMARTLRAAVDGGYRGRREEGKSLAEFAGQA